MATMFPCPNCGGQLRYQPKGQMKCMSCGSEINPEIYTPDEKVKGDTIDTKIFTCSACSGEIQLIDNDGMEFCPYCGSQATMQERFSSEGAPKYILPFERTKADIKKRYKALTKSIPYVPDGLSDEANIEKMVGMYVPYYLYDYSIHDSISYKGEKTVASGGYDITYYAYVDMNFDTDQLRVPYDASETLDDTIAAKLEPFPMKNLKEFKSNYLAGYFVENSTVEKNLYANDAVDKAAEYAYNTARKDADYDPSSPSKDQVIANVAKSLNYNGVEGAYLPLYFSTTKYGDRVAYSIANGASANTYIDMPIDRNKMYRKAILVSAVIFLLLLIASFVLNFSYSIKGMCSYAAFISSLIAYTGATLARNTYDSDNHLYDKGFNPNAKTKTKKNGFGSTFLISLLAFGIIILVSIILTTGSDGLIVFHGILYLISFILCIVAMIKNIKGKKTVLLLGLLGWLTSVFIRLLNQPSDLFYYGALMGVFAVIILSINSMVSEYNRFATHPSPQFFKKGGGLEGAKD